MPQVSRLSTTISPPPPPAACVPTCQIAVASHHLLPCTVARYIQIRTVQYTELLIVCISGTKVVHTQKGLCSLLSTCRPLDPPDLGRSLPVKGWLPPSTLIHPQDSAGGFHQTSPTASTVSFHTSTTCSATLQAIRLLYSNFILRFVCPTCSASSRLTTQITRLTTHSQTLELPGRSTRLAWKGCNGAPWPCVPGPGIPSTIADWQSSWRRVLIPLSPPPKPADTTNRIRSLDPDSDEISNLLLGRDMFPCAPQLTQLPWQS